MCVQSVAAPSLGHRVEAARGEVGPVAGSRRDFHIPSLDGIRAISFLLVFVAHAGLGNLVPGGFGVTVFFFLSGYLITTLLRLEYLGTRRISLRDFYLRRALRILPSFYAVLLFALLLSLIRVLPGELQALPVVAQLAHFTNYWNVFHGIGGQPAGTGVYWSLAVEEHFYLAFPFLFILLQRLYPGRVRTQGSLLLALCAGVLLWRLFLVLHLHSQADRTYLASDTRIDSILFGCALALMANPMLEAPSQTARRLWRNVLLPLGLAVLLFSFTYRAPWFRETLRYTVQGLALAPLFVVAMLEPRLGPFRALNLPAVRHIGVLSYSLYLVHHVVIYAVEEQLPQVHAVLRGLLCLALSLALAESVHRLIERPCGRLRRRLAHANWMTLPAAVQQDAGMKGHGS
jgi:peptidoglycan/LPS O-acetylase OafA/YrhL